MAEEETFAALAGIEKQLTRIAVALYVIARLEVDKQPHSGSIWKILDEVLEEGCWPKEEPES